MSLKPKRVDFSTTWADLKETVKGVITFSNVPRTTWNDRFTGKYQLCFMSGIPTRLKQSLSGPQLKSSIFVELDFVQMLAIDFTFNSFLICIVRYVGDFRNNSLFNTKQPKNVIVIFVVV